VQILSCLVYSLLDDASLIEVIQKEESATKRKAIFREIVSRDKLINSVCYIDSDCHPFYIKIQDEETGLYGIEIMFGSKTPEQKNKRPFYWIDNHGKFRKSFIKGGRAKKFLALHDIHIKGIRITDPIDKSLFLTKHGTTRGY
jgi:hypothetical protein